MAEQFVITNASVQDVDAIIAMHAQSWRDTYPNQAAGVSKEWVLDRVAKWRSPEKRAQRLEKIKQSTYDPDIIYKVAAYNERAKAFYKKYGFIEVEGSQRMYDVIPVVQMIHKSLAEEVIR